jgi:REP element-mobilizing transposase RayT
MRAINFTANKYYHLSGRGVGKQKLFCDEKDLAKFLFLILYLQSPTPINNIDYYVSSFLKNKSFRVGDKKTKEIIKTRYLKVVSFVLMPNHFHILVKNLEDQVISVYMHRILTSYSKYFNAKYKTRGHVFEGPFEANQAGGSELLNASACIHKNPIESETGRVIDYEKYDWSSYGDFININRWGELLATNVISEHFKNPDSYKNFVSTYNTPKGHLYPLF